MGGFFQPSNQNAELSTSNAPAESMTADDPNWSQIDGSRGF